MSDYKSNYGTPTNPWGPLAAPMEQWVTALRTWSDMWSAFLPAGWPCIPQQIWNPGAVSPPSSVAAPSVSVRVSSLRPTEVMATLVPGSEYLPLVAEVPNLSGVSISREGAKVCVEVEVAPTQAAGTYQGFIVAVGREVGTISVTISETPAASKPAAKAAPRPRRRRAPAAA